MNEDARARLVGVISSLQDIVDMTDKDARAIEFVISDIEEEIEILQSISRVITPKWMRIDPHF